MSRDKRRRGSESLTLDKENLNPGKSGTKCGLTTLLREVVALGKEFLDV